jgi:hypothetical protein
MRTLLPASLLALATLASPAAHAANDIVCLETQNTLGFPNGCVYTDYVPDATVRLVDWNQGVHPCLPPNACPLAEATSARALVHDQDHVALTIVGGWETLPPVSDPCGSGGLVCICTDCIAWMDMCLTQCLPCYDCFVCIEGPDGGCMSLPPIVIGPLPEIPDAPRYVASGVALADIDQDGGFDGVGLQIQDTWFVVPVPCDAQPHHALTCTVPLP